MGADDFSMYILTYTVILQFTFRKYLSVVIAYMLQDEVKMLEYSFKHYLKPINNY